MEALLQLFQKCFLQIFDEADLLLSFKTNSIRKQKFQRIMTYLLEIRD